MVRMRNTKVVGWVGHRQALYNYNIIIVYSGSVWGKGPSASTQLFSRKVHDAIILYNTFYTNRPIYYKSQCFKAI